MQSEPAAPPAVPARPGDDYLVEGDETRPGVTFAARLLRLLRLLVLIVLAVASFGLFWVLTALLGLR